MPATIPGGLSLEPQRALLTPSASPSVPPPKRPRLRSTSSISATPSTSNESSTSAEVFSARRESTLRVLNVWAQLAERYNRRLDEDDIVDLYSGAIIKDRGVVKGTSRDYPFGHFSHLDGDHPDGDQDQEDSEQDADNDDDDDDNELLHPSEATTDDGVSITKKLRGVPPLSATTDAEDLKEFLEAEEKRRELAGEEEDEEELSPEQLFAVRRALEEQSQDAEAATVNQPRDTADVEHPLEREADATPTHLSTRVAPSDDESEDELALWTRDESTAIYPVARGVSEPDVHRVEREVIKLVESDSDEEFEAILTRPPRFTRVSPLPTPSPKQVQRPLQSPPNGERRRSKSRARSQPKTKTKATPKSKGRLSASPVPQPEVNLAHIRMPSVSKATGTVAPDNGGSDQEVIGRTSPAHKGKSKEIPVPADDDHGEKIAKSLGVVSRGRKRKRIASSTNGNLLVNSPESKGGSRCRGRPPSQSSTTLPQPDGPGPPWGEDTSTPVRSERVLPGPSCRLLSLSPTSKTLQSALSDATYRSPEPELVQPTSHSYSSNIALPLNLPTACTYPHSQRHPSHSSPIFSSPNQGTPGLSFAGGQLPPPMDPAQTQQAHYLLAQAMQHLSYVISTTMPPYTGYMPNSGQPWQQPPFPPPHATFSTPIQHPSHLHGARHYHTPSSSISRSGLPPSSPVQSSMSPPLEEQPRSRGRSKSRGRRVSFKLDSEDAACGGREHNIQPEFPHSGPKQRKQIVEVNKRESGKERGSAEFEDAFRLEEHGGPPQLTRGRTPGPPSRKRIDVPRGRSLSRR